MSELEQYSIVCRSPNGDLWTVCPYTGDDLSQVRGISQASMMPQGTYGWVQTVGAAELPVVDGTEHVYVDFGPNEARQAKQDGRKLDQPPLDERRQDRLCQLNPLLIEVGHYCQLLREARDVFIGGHFYSCVAMCGIAMERFQFDKASPYGANRKHKMYQIQRILKEKNVLKPESLTLCEKMAELRNDYAHGHGMRPQEDAVEALRMMQRFIEGETSLMRRYHVVNGKLRRSEQL